MAPLTQFSTSDSFLTLRNVNANRKLASTALTKHLLNAYIKKNVDLKRRQIISLPGGPKCLGPALSVH